MTQVPAARNTLRILTLLTTVGVPISAARIRAELDLPRSTTYHLLAEMETAGYVVRLPEEQTFGLGLAAYAMANAYTTQQPLVRLGSKLVDTAAELVQGSGHIARMSGSEIVYLYEHRSPGAVSLVTDIGVRLQAHRTASGKAMLAALPEVEARAAFATAETGTRTWRDFRAELARVREQGFAEEIEEVSRGQRSLAVPVLDHLSRPAAALTVTYPVSRDVDETTKAELAAHLARTARHLSGRIYGR
ncbi:IclR family transcriptional regulator [Corynebacterium sp. YIM 101645]|uniref:IclR family transcriptional regulator n=1 Tax=Corynebacterium lemuris TaxID=1859292 RepID=A0ABT2FUN3_9CORY|nr:IclR family transcriptional regulator [Corynebacterium lemuris]MCS5478941.1 IclR family transcriptional regulator [Corynebacterium lemuris]